MKQQQYWWGEVKLKIWGSLVRSVYKRFSTKSPHLGFKYLFLVHWTQNATNPDGHCAVSSCTVWVFTVPATTPYTQTFSAFGNNNDLSCSTVQSLAASRKRWFQKNRQFVCCLFIILFVEISFFFLQTNTVFMFPVSLSAALRWLLVMQLQWWV